MRATSARYSATGTSSARRCRSNDPAKPRASSQRPKLCRNSLRRCENATFTSSSSSLASTTGGCASGTIRTTTLALGDLPGRLKILFDGITEVAARYEPDVASVEIVFVNVNPQSTLLLGQARGACLTALVASDLNVAEYTALQMKKAVAGYGKAGKAEVQEMVKRLLKLPGVPGKDAADALGLAIAHAHIGPGTARLAQATPLERRAHSMFAKGRRY